MQEHQPPTKYRKRNTSIFWRSMDDKHHGVGYEDLVVRAKQEIECKDRTYHLKTYKDCFLGMGSDSAS